MKHQHSADISVDLPTQDLEDLSDRIADNVIIVIAFYTACDVARHILKRLI